MQRWIRLVRNLSPWIALGLGGALLAIYLRPSLLPRPRAAPAGATLTVTGGPPRSSGEQIEPMERHSAVASYADAITRAAPAVVNISTRKVVLERQVPQQLAPWFPDWPEFRRREESSRGSGVILRFIEYMDVGTRNHWKLDEVVPSRELRDRIHARWPRRTSRRFWNIWPWPGRSRRPLRIKPSTP